jgi:hypothetical protein
MSTPTILKQTQNRTFLILTLGVLFFSLNTLAASVPGSVPCYMALKEAEKSTEVSSQETIGYLENLMSSYQFKSLKEPAKNSELFFRSDKQGNQKAKIKQVASQIRGILDYSKTQEENSDKVFLTEGFTIKGDRNINSYLEFLKSRSLELKDAKLSPETYNGDMHKDFVKGLTKIGLVGASLMPLHPALAVVGAVPFVFATESLLHQFFVRQDFSFVSKINQIQNVLEHGEAGHVVHLSRRTRFPQLIDKIREHTEVGDPNSESNILHAVDTVVNPSLTNKFVIDFISKFEMRRTPLERPPYVFADWILETNSQGESLLHFVFRYSLPKKSGEIVDIIE